MSVRYERDDTARRVVVTIQGPFEVADFSAVIARRQADDTGAYGTLFDLRGMTGEPSIANLREFMSTAAQTARPRGAIALLATDPAIYARACTYATMMGHSTALTIAVFRDLVEAAQWLTDALKG